MSIQPKKLKVHLGVLKTLVDAVPLPSSTPTPTTPSRYRVCYRLLLLAELSQRGVVGSTPPSEDDDEGATTTAELLETIQKTAGRTPLDETSGVPKQLVAAAAAVAGIAAESCARHVGPDLSSSEGDAASAVSFSKEACRGASERCREVGDVRFRTLLDLGCDTELGAEGKRRALLTIAVGSNLRAAGFSNPDQPPVWKRALDVALKLNDGGVDRGEEGGGYTAYHTVHAALPLRNLLRIAKAKGNARRVSELGLRLAESYLAHDENDDLKKEPAFRTFVLPYADDTDRTRLQRIDMAEEAFSHHVPDDRDDGNTDALLSKLVRVRIKTERERAVIDAVVAVRRAAADNRAGITDKPANTGGFGTSLPKKKKKKKDDGTSGGGGKEVDLEVGVRRDVLASRPTGADVVDIVVDSYIIETE